MSWIILGNTVIKRNSVIKSIPVPVSAEVTNDDPGKVKITFDQALLDTSIPATTAFALVGKTISNVAIVGAVVTLTVTVAYLFYDTGIIIEYTKPALNPLKALTGGGQVASFTGQSVTNNINKPILDANTIAWFAVGDGSDTYMIKDGSNFVSELKDLSGNNRHLQQATGTKQPIYNGTELVFDGSNDTLRTANINQVNPIFVYMVFKLITWADGDVIYDSNGGRIYCFMSPSSPSIKIFSLTAGSDPVSCDIGNYNILRALHKGADSTLQIDNNTIASGINIGTQALTEITIGSENGASAYSNIAVKEIIYRSTADDTSTQIDIYNYFADKYGFTRI